MGIDSVDGSDATQSAAVPDNTTAAKGEGTINASTKFNSMAQLRDEEPTLYKQITIGLGVEIINESRRAQERHHQLEKDYERNS